MAGFLVGYESGNIYRIYHPDTKEFKVSRDVIFSENKFFNARQKDQGSELEGTDTGENEMERDIQIDKSQVGESRETTTLILHDQIVVQSLSQYQELSKAPNRRMRRQIARAFKATLKGNWRWPRNYYEAMEADDAKQWELAMKKELDSIMKNKTWTLVPLPKDAKVIKSRWVLRTKDNGMYKACFCAKGFTQRWGEDYDETFAPVAKYISIRTLLALLLGHKKAKIHQMDVNTAFLYSSLDETVHVEQPEGFVVPGKEDYVCLLQKALYGLKQSPRA